MSKTIFSFVMSLGLGLGAITGIAAEETKVGTVDLQKAIEGVESGKHAKTQLEKDVNGKKGQLQTEEASLIKLRDELKKQSLVLNDEAKAKKAQEFQERVMKFEEMKNRSQMEIQQKQHDLFEPIIAKMRVIIKDLAKTKGYSVVLEKNENTVLFSQEKDDLTSDVISNYNKQNKG